MDGSDEREAKHERIRRQRHEFIKQWAEYVRTHPDEEWGEQVNTLISSQIESARHFEDVRPDLDRRPDASPADPEGSSSNAGDTNDTEHCGSEGSDPDRDAER